MKKILLLILFILFSPIPAKAATSVTEYGIAWTFDHDYEVGQFANGDYWVLDPGDGVTIIEISPKSSNVGGRIQNGSMLNPTETSNGYDSTVNNWTYNPAVNVGRPNGNDLSIGNPLMITGDASLVSTKTNDVANTRPQLVDASVLTILTKSPPAGSFRPPYSGTDKTTHWNISDIQWNLLPKLSKTSITNLPDLSYLSSRIERVWLDHGGGSWTGREIHPSNNMPDYGRDMANITGDVSMTLLLDYSQAELEPLMMEFLQLGIDWYGVTENRANIFTTTTQGGLWMGGGGHGIGRKWPMVFTGLMLNDSNILKYADAENYPIFQEEQQYFYVKKFDVDLARYTADGRLRDPYTSDMIGLPEWGESYWNIPERAGSNWNVAYREIVSRSISGHDLAATIMRAKPLWNWPVFFEYQDRWAAHQAEIGSTISYSAFVDSVWNIYRVKYGPVYGIIRADVNNSSQVNTTDALLTLRNSLGLAMSGTAWQVSATTGDVNCDSVSNSADALLILRYSLGLSMGGTAWCEG